MIELSSDANGNSPLLTAICSLAYECLAVMLAASVNITRVNKSGATLLHLTACWGDDRIVDTLLRSQIRGLDVRAINKMGRSLMQVLASRPNRPVGLDKSFVKLLANIEAVDIKDNDSNVFLDADDKLYLLDII